MENQQKYQPLLKKILENLEAERGDGDQGSYPTRYELEVPAVQPGAMVESNFSAHTPSNAHYDTPHQAVGMREEMQIPGQDFAQFTPVPAPAPFSAPQSDQYPPNQYESPPLEEGVANVGAAPGESAHQLQPLGTQDQIPALFHRQEPDNNGYKIPITKALYGLTGAILIGAASAFYIMPEPQSGSQTKNKLAVAQTTIRLFPETNTTDFATDNRYALSGGVTGQSWETGPQGNLLDNTSKDPLINPTHSQPDLFASINGPIEQLVNNAVKDQSAPGMPKPDMLGSNEVVSFDQTKDPAQTLNQLENSLENIVNAASRDLSEPTKQIVIAQASNNSAGNVAPAAKAAPDKMRALTDQVVEALSDLNGAENTNSSSLNQSVDRLRATLSDLVQEAENQGKGVKSVEHLLEEALGKSQQTLPAALKNADGSLDISTLIASIVKVSDGKPNTSGADADYLALIEDEGAKTALSSRIITQKGKGRYLIVKAGDTLSSIAYATYGDAFAYPKIFNANKATIKNANSLAIGMRLTIPR